MGSPMETADEEPVFTFDTSADFSSPPPAKTFRVNIRVMNFTDHWIQPIHEGVATYLQKSPVVLWRGKCTVRPWSNIVLLNLEGYEGKTMHPGQFESDGEGGMKCASLVRSPDSRLVMVLVVDVERWGKRMEARVLVVDQDTDFQSAEFEKKCDEAGKIVKFDCTLGGKQLKFQLDADIATTKWPPPTLFNLHDITGEDEILKPIPGTVDLTGASVEYLEKMVKKHRI